MEKLFELYVAAFLSLDPSNVSGFYAFPVTFYAETGEVVVFDDRAFLENSEKLFAIYKNLGVSDIDFDIVNQESSNDAFTQASVLWTFNDANGSIIYSATTRYLIHLESSKIVSVTTVDEMRKIQQLLN